MGEHTWRTESVSECERCGRNAKPASGEKRLDSGEKGNLRWQVLRTWDERQKADTHEKMQLKLETALSARIPPVHLCALCSE